MIYHDNKYISLGSGDVCVGGTWNAITFQNIRPPQECGAALSRDQEGLEFLGDIVSFEFNNIKDLNEFGSKFRQIREKQTDCIEYKGWKLYFLPNSDASVEVVRNHFELLVYRTLNSMAC